MVRSAGTRNFFLSISGSDSSRGLFSCQRHNRRASEHVRRTERSCGAGAHHDDGDPIGVFGADGSAGRFPLLERVLLLVRQVRHPGRARDGGAVARGPVQKEAERQLSSHRSCRPLGCLFFSKPRAMKMHRAALHPRLIRPPHTQSPRSHAFDAAASLDHLAGVRPVPTRESHAQRAQHPSSR